MIEANINKQKRNITFTILSAIGITLILLGHLDYGILTFGGLFPYYSYHVMIFVFISGYFYKSDDETRLRQFVIRKAKRLLLPYFIWNAVYGVIVMLMRKAGFGIGEEISLYNLIIAPFMGGHQFGLNAPAWFIPALFLLQMCDIAVRTAVRSLYVRFGDKKLKGEDHIYVTDPQAHREAGDYTERLDYGKYEWIWMALYLAIGILVVYLAKRGSVYDWYKLPGRLMLMAPVFEFGRLYKNRIEKVDCIPSCIYFPVLFAINLILNYAHGGLAYSVVWVTGFGGSVITPFITALTGIALWLRVSEITASVLEKGGAKPDAYPLRGESGSYQTVRKDSIRNLVCRGILAIGGNTYSICMHHLLVFMGIKYVFVLINRISGACPDIDMDLFYNDIYYTYVPSGNSGFKLLYLTLGIMLPVIAALLVQKLKSQSVQKLKSQKS